MSGRRTPAQVRAEEDRTDRIREAEQDDIRVLMETPQFRRYLRRYLEITSVFRTTFTGNSETFFREGQRSIGTTMFGEFHLACGDRFMQLMSEDLHSELIKSPDAADED